MRITDRNVLAHLETASWVDVSHALEGSSARTAPTACFTGTDFATMRCDYLLASQAWAALTRSYRMIRNEASDIASDRYAVLTSFEVSR
jgi:hypothetical protein